MKKLKYFMFAFILVLSGLAVGMPLAFLNHPSHEIALKAEINENVVEITDEADYVSVMSNVNNYASNIHIKLTQNLDFKDVDMSRVYALNEAFAGTFDGNGFQVSNITISSTDGTLGFIKSAKGSTDGLTNKPAIIKNLKLAETIKYDIDEENVSTLFIGAILGDGNDVIIENCEIANGTTLIGNDGPISIKSKLTFGGIAGRLTNNSMIYNCVSDFTTVIKSYLSATTQAKVGGVVGRLSNSRMFNVVSKSKISFFAESSNVSLYFGGLIGESEQENDTDSNNALIYNLNYLGTYAKVEASQADEYKGAVIGNLVKMPMGRLISCNYWVDGELGAFGINNVWTNQDSYNVKKVDAITGAFLGESSNWDGRSLGYDFKQTWQIINGATHLQVFQSYNYTFADIVDSKNVLDTNGGYVFSKAVYRYGEDVVINLKFKFIYQGFYDLSDVLLNSSIVDTDGFEIVESMSEDGQIKGYTITFKASDNTDGAYSFNFKANMFDCEIITEDFNKGGVKYKDGSVNASKLTLNLTVESSIQNIVAVPFGIHSFDHWELYYRDADGALSEKVNFEKATNSTLEIRFSTAPFNRKFVLKSFFNTSEALSVDFSSFDKTSIEKITFSGEEYIGNPIKVSSVSTKIELAVTVKEKFVLDVDNFIKNISQLYGNNDTSALKNFSIIPGENGAKVYKFSINVSSIKSGLAGAKEFSISLLTMEDKAEGGNNLMWLWITLPIAGVVLIGGIILFFIIRRRRFNQRMLSKGSSSGSGSSNKKSKSKPKKIDYKDYYN